MTYPATLRQLNEYFEYQPNDLDTWTPIRYVPHANHPDGALIGDSQSYAMSVLFIVADGSWLRMLWMILTGKATFFQMYERGQHKPDISLFIFGRGYISSSTMIFHRENSGDLIYPIPRLYVFCKMLMGAYTRRIIRKRGF